MVQRMQQMQSREGLQALDIAAGVVSWQTEVSEGCLVIGVLESGDFAKQDFCQKIMHKM